MGTAGEIPGGFQPEGGHIPIPPGVSGVMAVPAVDHDPVRLGQKLPGAPGLNKKVGLRGKGLGGQRTGDARVPDQGLRIWVDGQHFRHRGPEILQDSGIPALPPLVEEHAVPVIQAQVQGHRKPPPLHSYRYYTLRGPELEALILHGRGLVKQMGLW